MIITKANLVGVLRNTLKNTTLHTIRNFEDETNALGAGTVEATEKTWNRVETRCYTRDSNGRVLLFFEVSDLKPKFTRFTEKRQNKNHPHIILQSVV